LLIRGVILARRCAALLLLALWLPATLHCALEAAGFDLLFPCVDDHEAGTHHTDARDSCDVVEGTALKPAANSVRLSQPVICVRVLGFVAPAFPILATPPATGVSALVAAPPEVARTWHFVVRAAPPPRAPSHV